MCVCVRARIYFYRQSLSAVPVGPEPCVPTNLAHRSVGNENLTQKGSLLVRQGQPRFSGVTGLRGQLEEPQPEGLGIWNFPGPVWGPGRGQTRGEGLQ